MKNDYLIKSILGQIVLVLVAWFFLFMLFVMLSDKVVDSFIGSLLLTLFCAYEAKR